MREDRAKWKMGRENSGCLCINATASIFILKREGLFSPENNPGSLKLDAIEDKCGADECDTCSNQDLLTDFSQEVRDHVVQAISSLSYE